MKNNHEMDNKVNPNEWLIKANESISERGMITDIIRINEHQVRAKVNGNKVVYYDYIEDRIIDRREIDKASSSIVDSIDEIDRNGNHVVGFSIVGDKVIFKVYDPTTGKEEPVIRDIKKYNRRHDDNRKSNRSRHGRRN